MRPLTRDRSSSFGLSIALKCITTPTSCARASWFGCLTTSRSLAGDLMRRRKRHRCCWTASTVARTFVGVFDAEALIGMSVLESARVGRDRDQMQLASLYVSRPNRGRGIGTQLFEAAGVRSHGKPTRRRSTSHPYPPRTPSTSTSIEAVSSRQNPTPRSSQPAQRHPPRLSALTPCANIARRALPR